MDGNWVSDLRPSFTASSTEPCCPPALLAAATAVLGPGPVAWSAEVARSVEAKVTSFTPELAGPSSVDALRRPIEACTLALLEMLHADSASDDVRVPELVIASNRDLVHRGFPLDRLLRTIWTSHAYAHQQLLTFLERHAGPGVLSSQVGRATELSFAFAEALTARLTEEFTAEQAAWSDTVPALRRQAVDDILAGRRPPTRNLDQLLRLNVGGYVAGAIVWTESSMPGAGAPADPARVAAAVASVSEAAGSLVVPTSASTTWLWLAFPARPPHQLGAKLRRDVPAPPGMGVALGPVRAGLDGFRQSHQAAARIRRLGAALATPGGPWLFDHAELDLLALLTDEPEHARWFVRDHLGGLAGPGRRLVDLRETLRLYLRFGRSRAAAAKALHVVPNTVAYRVKQAEQLLAGGLPSDTLHLRVALEICDLVREGGSAD